MLIVPRLACPTQHRYLAAGALHLLRDREERFPTKVTNGELTAAQSAAGMELMRVVAAQWRWVIDKSQPALPPFDYDNGRFGAPNCTLETEVQKIADAARGRADRAPADNNRQKMAELCEALAWYQQTCCGDARIVWHYIHREAAAVSAAA